MTKYNEKKLDGGEAILLLLLVTSDFTIWKYLVFISLTICSNLLLNRANIYIFKVHQQMLFERVQ